MDNTHIRRGGSRYCGIVSLLHTFTSLAFSSSVITSVHSPCVEFPTFRYRYADRVYLLHSFMITQQVEHPPNTLKDQIYKRISLCDEIREKVSSEKGMQFLFLSQNIALLYHSWRALLLIERLDKEDYMLSGAIAIAL